MSLTLDDALDTAAALEERLAAALDDGDRARLAERKAQVDFAAFGLFKAAQWAQSLGELRRPLAWGLGLGLPALGVGHALLSDAHQQGDEFLANARNQALLTALGAGGLQALGGAAQNLLGPPRTAEPEGQKLGAADRDLSKLAALLVVDDVLEKAYATAGNAEKVAVAECLFINRAQGTALLRKLR